MRRQANLELCLDLEDGWKETDKILFRSLKIMSRMRRCVRNR